METVKLNNGVEMPILGYGVFQVGSDECQRCVRDALDVGYRLIDTAQAYYNEEGVGAAIKNSGVKREDVFLVTKIWISRTTFTLYLRAYGSSFFRSSRIRSNSTGKARAGATDSFLATPQRTHSTTQSAGRAPLGTTASATFPPCRETE